MALAGLITSITSGRQCFVVVLNFILGLTIGIFVTVFMPQTESFNAGVAMMHQYSRGLLKNAPSNHTFTTPGTLLYKEKPEFTTPGVVLAGKTNDTAIPQNMPPEEQGKPTPKVPDGASGEKFTHATGPLLLDDKAYHQDDVTLAESLAKQVRVLCWVMTQPSSHETKAKIVKETWGKRCNMLLFISETSDASLPSIGITEESGREHLTAKTMRAFDYVYKNHLTQYDWFLKADDDTYVIVENLRYMLSSYSPQDLIYFGHHFYSKSWGDMAQGYFSGGGGYVLSRGALREFGARPSGLCASDHGAEDVQIGYCMERLHVRTGDSRDSMGRSRFHCFPPTAHIRGNYPDWYYTFDKYGAPKGVANMSDYAISFHYIPPEMMWMLEFYVYHLRPFGIASGPQKINSPSDSPQNN